MPEKKTSLGILLFFLLLVFSGLFWWTLDRSVRMDDGRWFDVLGWFSLLLPLLCTASIVLKGRLHVVAALLVVFLPTFIFAPYIGHTIDGLLAGLLVWAGFSRTKSDIQSRISIHLTKSLHLGMFLILTGFALVISGHYYYQVRSLPLENLLPRFTMGEVSSRLFAQLLVSVNPQLRQVNQEHLTVDDLIRSFMITSTNSGDETTSNEEMLRAAGMRLDDPMARAQLAQWKQTVGTNNVGQLEEQLALEEGRKRLSESLGIALSGNESVSDVLTRVINNKMRLYFTPSPDTPQSLLPFILASLLFLTLLSLSTILQWVWIGLTVMFFFIAVRIGGVTLRKVLVQQEVIE